MYIINTLSVHARVFKCHFDGTVIEITIHEVAGVEMKSTIKIIYLLIFVSLLSQSAIVYDLERDYSSLNARIDILLNPNLKEFVFSTHILDLDHGGMLFLALLKMASGRGVKITGVVDSSLGGGNVDVLSFLEENRIKIGFYNPITLKQFNIFGPLESFTNINKRLHDKGWVAVIQGSKDENGIVGPDKYIALTGDKNISAKYFAMVKVLLPKQTTMNGRETIIDGGSVPEKIYSYFVDMISNNKLVIFPKFKGSSAKAEKFSARLEKYIKWIEERQIRKVENANQLAKNWRKIKFDIPDENIEFISDRVENGERISTYKQVLNELRNAEPGEDILIENPYFVLEPELIQTLEELKRKNCKVVLLSNLPEYSDVWFIRQSFKVDLKKIAELGVEVHFIASSKTITHSKMAVIGNRKVYRGSANFDPRSLSLNSESGEIYSNQEMAEYYKQRFYTRILSYGVIGAKDGKVFVDEDFQKFYFKHSVAKFIIESLSFSLIKYEIKPYSHFKLQSRSSNVECRLHYQEGSNYKENIFRTAFVNMFRSFL